MASPHNLLKHVRADLFFPMYWLGHLVPKNHRLWVFGSGHGESFKDNGKHFFKYLCHHQRKIRCVWLTQRASVVTEVQDGGYEAYDFSTLRGCWLALRAGVAIVNYGYSADLNAFAITGGTKLVQLWHGTPLKKIGADDKYDHTRPSLIPHSQQWGLCHWLQLRNRRFFWRLYPRRPIDLLIAASDEVKKVFQGAFNLSPDLCKVTGYPRNDVLFAPPTMPSKDGQRQVVYLPTWRGQAQDQVSFFEFDVEQVNALLRQHNIVLYFKPHPANTPRAKFVQRIRNSSNIRFLECDDLYEVLNSFDVLVTDYSSIYFDYLLLDRPIVFLAPDLETYTTGDHELYYDYASVTPGPKVRTWEEMVMVLAEELAHPERHAEQRNVICKRFNTYCDGKSSERMFKEIQSLLD